MTGSNFRSNLFSKKRSDCFNYIDSNLYGKKLILAIQDLIFLSVSIDTKNEIVHPVCIINSLKNFIGDNRNNPSKILLKFGIDYLFQFGLRKNDKILLEKTIDQGNVKTAFTGDLEDACQRNDWTKAEMMLVKLFIASDRSRATFDLLAELALQDSPRNVLFIHHILRAYQFQEHKNDNWTFIMSIFNQIHNKKLPRPHKVENSKSDFSLNNLSNNSDIVLFMAMKRIWESEYVRSRGYNREISYWLTKIDFQQQNEFKNNYTFQKLKKLSFISVAEDLVKGEESTDEKLEALLLLEALRSACNMMDKKQYNKLVFRFIN